MYLRPALYSVSVYFTIMNIPQKTLSLLAGASLIIFSSLSAVTTDPVGYVTETIKPATFNLRLEQGTVGYHSPGRSRQYMWVNGEKVKLDDRDPGGEHE